MAEFCGAYTLVENNNMRDFAAIALANALAKIAFHTGIVACQVYDLLCKTLCQLVIVKEDNSTFSWFVVFDQEPLKGNVRIGDVQVDPSGVNFRMKSTRIGEEFLLSVPITGEKVKSVIKRKNPSSLEQTVHFQSGLVEVTYNRGSDNDIRVQFFHKASGTRASQLYKKNACFFEVQT